MQREVIVERAPAKVNLALHVLRQRDDGYHELDSLVAFVPQAADVVRAPIGHLSRGYRQRVGLAGALLGDPPLLVLDEPTVGLDPVQVEDVRRLLRTLPDDRAVVFSSHLLAEVEAVCDRVVILAEGRVVADEPVGGRVEIRVRWDADPSGLLEAAAAACGRAIPRPSPRPDGTFEATIPAAAGEAERIAEAVGRASAAAGVAVLELSPRRSRLEERFLEAAGGPRKEAGG